MELPQFITLGPRAKPLTGQVFGRLTVLGPVRRRSQQIIYLCLCECGRHKEVQAGDLRNGRSKSCGCLQIELTRARSITHGQAHGRINVKNKHEKPIYRGSRTYRIWVHMRARCLNPKNKGYPDYGGRGITICDRWDSFQTFYEDMGDCPPGCSIERVDNNQGYSPDNCCWADQVTQGNNKRNNVIITYRGQQMTLGQAVRLAGVRYAQAYDRIRIRGKDPEKTLDYLAQKAKAG